MAVLLCVDRYPRNRGCTKKFPRSNTFLKIILPFKRLGNIIWYHVRLLHSMILDLRLCERYHEISLKQVTIYQAAWRADVGNDRDLGLLTVTTPLVKSET
jgi:hypothetical protein